MQRKEPTDLIGLDISSHQTMENSDKFFYNSLHFNYFRAYGSNHNAIDTSFVANVEKAKRYGIPSGAYYFGTPKKTADIVGHAKSQAKQFVDALRIAYKGGAGDLIPFLDIETYTDTETGHVREPMSSGMTARQLIDWIKAFRDYFFKETGRRLGFYTNEYFMTDPHEMGIPPSDPLLQEIANMPLWIAQYDYWYGGIGGNQQPTEWGGWKNYAMWQYSVIENADYYGLKHPQNQVDHNRVKDLSWIMPPKPIQEFQLEDLGEGVLKITVKHPEEADYLGASVYINHQWAAWIAKNLNEITVKRAAGLQEVHIATEDQYHDTTISSTKKINLA